MIRIERVAGRLGSPFRRGGLPGGAPGVIGWQGLPGHHDREAFRWTGIQHSQPVGLPGGVPGVIAGKAFQGVRRIRFACRFVPLDSDLSRLFWRIVGRFWHVGRGL